MHVTFYIAAAIAVLSTLMVITRLNLIHALLYFVVSLLSVAVVFFTLGAPFVAALEVIIYAGAIMVLFVFAIMMLTFGPHASRRMDRWISRDVWLGPGLLSAILLGEVLFLLSRGGSVPSAGRVVEPKEIGISLFSGYLLGVELSSLILMAALLGAFRLGRREPTEQRKEDGT